MNLTIETPRKTHGVGSMVVQTLRKTHGFTSMTMQTPRKNAWLYDHGHANPPKTHGFINKLLIFD